MKYEVVSYGYLRDLDADSVLSADEAEAALDDVMDHLVDLGAVDPAVSLASGPEHVVEISVTVLDAEDPGEANVKGGGIIRTALHAAGAHTPGWEIEWCEVRARKAEQLTLA